MGEGVQRGAPPSRLEATMLPCSTSPAVAPVAAATAAAAAVTEAGEVVCLLPTVNKSSTQSDERKEQGYKREGAKTGRRSGVWERG